MSTASVQVFELGPLSELRFEVPAVNETAVLKVKSGYAEMFGSELLLGRPYEFQSGAEVAIFTWNGCCLELRDCTGFSYVSKQNTTGQYFKIHTSLEWQRRKADQKRTRGPVTMVVGRRDVGKSSLARVLLNYAVRAGRKPVFVDLDVEQGHISFPGTIGAMMVQQPASVEQGFQEIDPLVYHFGHRLPSANLKQYNHIVSKLAEVIAKRTATDVEAWASGVVIDTSGLIDQHGYEALIHAAQAFAVNDILVIDNERLAVFLKRDLASSVKITNLERNSGVITRAEERRVAQRVARLREYFCGGRSGRRPADERAHCFEVEFSDLKIYKIGAPDLPQSCMPLGTCVADFLTTPMAVTPGPELAHHVLAVLPAAEVSDALLHTNVAGFICITAVDMARRRATVLSAERRLAPGTVLLLSQLQYKHSR